MRGNWWRNKPTWWVAAGWVLFCIYFSILVVFRQANLFTSQFDMGNMDQALWQSLHGHWFQMFGPNGFGLASRAAFHADLLLLGYLPLYSLWQSPYVVLVAQVLAVGSGIWPLYWFAKRFLPARGAAVLALSYIVYPSLIWALMFDVHAVVLVIPLLLWMTWAAFERRWGVYWFAVLALVLAKEEVGATVALMGLYLMWKLKPRWIGLVTVVVGLSATIFFLGYYIPHIRQAPGHFALGYYSDFGQSESAVATGILLHPLRVAQKIFASDGLNYQAALLAPLGFTTLLGLPFSFVAIPELLINLLSSNPNLRTIFFQYTAVLTPIVFLGSVIGLGRLHGFLKSRRVVWRLAYLPIIGCALFSIYWWSPLPLLRYGHDAVAAFHTSPYRADIKTIQRDIPADARVAVSNVVAPQFTARDAVWSFPLFLDQADRVVVLTGGLYEVVPPDQIQAKVDAMIKDTTHWKLVLHDQALYYFVRLNAK